MAMRWPIGVKVPALRLQGRDLLENGGTGGATRTTRAAASRPDRKLLNQDFSRPYTTPSGKQLATGEQGRAAIFEEFWSRIDSALSSRCSDMRYDEIYDVRAVFSVYFQIVKPAGKLGGETICRVTYGEFAKLKFLKTNPWVG